ncbi:MAG: hypothetical protein R3F14_43325 [Polyangiaceae bacterium]
MTPGGEVSAFGEYTENGSTRAVQKPNRVALAITGDALFLGGSNGLFRMPLSPDGAVATGTRVRTDRRGTDGLGRDCAGNLYVTTGQTVAVLNRRGR